ncbi:MAG: hypothetical protein IKD89_07765 [Clostridia bacterium]|nr:hypothetical protein [Clostridia bacterium]
MRRYVRADKERGGESAKKRAGESPADITAFMEKKSALVFGIIDKGLKIMNDEKKLSEATLSQLTSTLNSLIDKWTELGEHGGERENNLFAAINGCTQEGFNDLPELFKAPENDDAVVEDEGLR